MSWARGPVPSTYRHPVEAECRAPKAACCQASSASCLVPAQPRKLTEQAASSTMAQLFFHSSAPRRSFNSDTLVSWRHLYLTT